MKIINRQNLYKYPFPPQNYIAEELLLGIILIYPSIFTYIIPLIKAEYFFLECHQIIYLHLIEIYKKNKLQTNELLNYLANTKILYQIGGINKIVNIMKQGQIFIPSTNIYIYIQELVELINYNYIKRLMIQYGQNIIQLAYIKQISNYKLYNKASYYLNFTEKKIPKNSIQTFHDLIANLLLKIQNKYDQNKKDLNTSKIFIKSGFNNLDQLISGFHDGDLIVIAGRPSMGKTSLAINIASNLIHNINTGLCIFSLEMSSEQILYKLIAISCNMNINYLIFNKFSKNQWMKIKTICNKLLKNFIYINDKANISIDYIEYTSKLLKKEHHDIQLIIIDYLQLIQTESLNQINRTQELSYITRKLKLLAQYLNIPVIILSQLNRSIELRNNKEPMLSDLKESGCMYINQAIDLQCNKTSLNIKSVIHHYTISKLIKTTINKIISNQAIQCNLKIYLFLEYVFKCNILNNIKILITYNHKYLGPSGWLRVDDILDKSSVLKVTNNLSCIQIFSYIQNIKFSEESFVYDLYLKKYFHFLCNQIILHNSIEQDSDIVMILYESEKKEISDSKILDINVCKNRNGSTGSFKLLFLPTTNIFKDLDLDAINN